MKTFMESQRKTQLPLEGQLNLGIHRVKHTANSNYSKQTYIFSSLIICQHRLVEKAGSQRLNQQESTRTSCVKVQKAISDCKHVLLTPRQLTHRTKDWSSYLEKVGENMLQCVRKDSEFQLLTQKRKAEHICRRDLLQKYESKHNADVLNNREREKQQA